MLTREEVRCVRTFAVLAGMVLLLSGCWDRLEIEDRAVILGIAIDLAESKEDLEEEMKEQINHSNAIGAPDMPVIKISAQIAVPGRIPLGPGESGGATVGEKPVWILNAKGHTVEEAMNALQQELADQIFLGHLRIIVVSEKYARNGLGNLNDYMRRQTDIRRTAWLAVSKGKATDIIHSSPQLERVPALYLLAMLDHSVDMGKLPNEPIGRYWIRNSNLGQEPILPYLVLKQQENVQVAGLAVFRKDKMVGATTPLQIGAYMAVNGISEGGYSFFVPVVNSSKNQYVLMRTVNRDTDTRLVFADGRPKIIANVSLEGNLREKTESDSYNFSDSSAIKELEKKN